MCYKELAFTVPDSLDGVKAETFLKKTCNVSARMIARLKREKSGILRNGEILRTIDILRAGDMVVLRLPADRSSVEPVKGELVVLYEDDYIIALDKPAGMPVHPTKVHQLDTLANRLSYRQKETGEDYVFRAVNRLDKDTTGIVLVAKDKYISTNLTADKIYFAVCEGVINGEGTIDTPIRLKEGHSIQREAAAGGLPAVTHYKAVLNLPDRTLLELRLETGRTHQIRCHLSSVGHPLMGDDMYGGSLGFISRQALHCGVVSFVHPITGERVTIKSELPNDIEELVR